MTDPTTAPEPLAAPSKNVRVLDVDRAVVAFGVALLATAVVLSTFYSRDRPHLDWSNYVVGLLATIGLLGVAVAAGLGILVPDRIDGSTDLVAWPGAFGAVGAGLMIGVALDDSSATAYVAGGVVLLISAAGVALTRRGPFVVTAIGGLFVLCAQLFDDVVGVDDQDTSYWPVALALLVFAVVVTAAGWPLATRVLSGVVAGAIAVAGFASLTGVLAVSGVIAEAFFPPTEDGSYADYQGDVPDITGNTWAVLSMALVLMLAWTGCAVLTGHVGFRLLVVAMAVSVTPLATIALRVDHPTWWGVVLAGIGGAVLVVVALRTSKRSGGATGQTG